MKRKIYFVSGDQGNEYRTFKRFIKIYTSSLNRKGLNLFNHLKGYQFNSEINDDIVNCLIDDIKKIISESKSDIVLCIDGLHFITRSEYIKRMTNTFDLLNMEVHILFFLERQDFVLQRNTSIILSDLETMNQNSKVNIKKSLSYNKTIIKWMETLNPENVKVILSSVFKERKDAVTDFYSFLGIRKIFWLNILLRIHQISHCHKDKIKVYCLNKIISNINSVNYLTKLMFSVLTVFKKHKLSLNLNKELKKSINKLPKQQRHRLYNLLMLSKLFHHKSDAECITKYFAKDNQSLKLLLNIRDKEFYSDEYDLCIAINDGYWNEDRSNEILRNLFEGVTKYPVISKSEHSTLLTSVEKLESIDSELSESLNRIIKKHVKVKKKMALDIE